MKKNILLSAMLIAVCGMFAGCANSDDITDAQASTPKTMELTITGSKTRSLTVDKGTNATVNNLVIGVFTGTGASAPDQIVNIDAPDISKAIKITYTTNSPNIVVVANVPKGTFTGVTSYDDFMSKAFTLDNTTATYASGTFTVPNPLTVDGQNQEMLPMYGKAENIVAGSSSDGTAGTADVKLSRAVARVSISSISTDFTTNTTYKGSDLTLNQVFMYNAHSSVTVGGTTSIDFLHG